MRRALLLALLALALIAATPQADVSVQAPGQAIPGETVQVAVQTSIQGVRVISVPLQVTVTWPDGEQTTLETTADAQGIYRGQLYVPQRGEYTIDAQATIGENTFSQQATLDVRRPALPLNISVNQTHVRVEADTQRTFDVRVFTPQPGPMDEQPLTCTVTCTQCAQQCPVGQGLAYINTSDVYDYTYLRSAQGRETLLAQPSQAIQTQGWYQVRDDALISLPPTTVFTQSQTLITPDARIIDLQVRDENATRITTQVAYDTRDGHWYARYTGERTGVLRTNHTITEAWTLDGEPLVHGTTDVLAQGPFEARIELQRTPPPLPDVQTTQYGQRVTGVEQPLRLRGSGAYALESTRALLRAHTAPQGAQVYYADQDHVRLPGPAVNGTYRPAYTQQAVSLNPPNQTRLTRILDAQLSSVFAQAGAPEQWTPQLPPGKYFVRYQTPEATYTEPVELLVLVLFLMGMQSAFFGPVKSLSSAYTFLKCSRMFWSASKWPSSNLGWRLWSVSM